MVKAVYGSRASETYASQRREARGPRTREAGGAAHRASSGGFQTSEDIIPIAELKANMSELVRGLAERPRPLVVTLNGKPAAVVMSPREYDRLSYQARFIDSVAAGLSDVEAGRIHDGDAAVAELMTELGVKKPRRSRAR
jgi:prevent-host-death family protein